MWEGGGYSGTPELSDMTQMQCATVLGGCGEEGAAGREEEEEKETESERKRGGRAASWLCFHTALLS